MMGTLVSGALALLVSCLAWELSLTLCLPQLSISAISLLAVGGAHEFTLSYVWGVLQAVVPGLLMNIFCVGVNQLSDVDVDKARGSSTHTPALLR